ncbi:hypothetical protein K456DRAFT_1941354 [Colletotrichum gloeosporioides 23]|nr:hypothetical protein K456DRAFT_1941354 [Colletotrichum gloeosporioides 23]
MRMREERRKTLARVGVRMCACVWMRWMDDSSPEGVRAKRRRTTRGRRAVLVDLSWAARGVPAPAALTWVYRSSGEGEDGTVEHAWMEVGGVKSQATYLAPWVWTCTRRNPRSEKHIVRQRRETKNRHRQRRGWTWVPQYKGHGTWVGQQQAVRLDRAVAGFLRFPTSSFHSSDFHRFMCILESHCRSAPISHAANDSGSPAPSFMLGWNGGHPHGICVDEFLIKHDFDTSEIGQGKFKAANGPWPILRYLAKCNFGGPAMPVEDGSLEVCPGEPSSLESVWRRPAAMCLVAGAGTRSAAAGLTNRQRCASHGPRPPTPHAASHIPRAGRPVNSAHPVANYELSPRHPIRPSPRGRKNRSSHYGYLP